MKILVTGANGQLGRSIQNISNEFPDFIFIFTDVEQLDITNLNQVKAFFDTHNPDFCINSAAYTQVDKAEYEKEINIKINQIGPKNLAIASKIHQSTLIHISSDYVYNSESIDIMDENSKTNPQGQYSQSKLAGEQEVIKETENYFILRTSWLYSEFGNNFVKTMIRLGNTLKSISVVNDQIGSPTYATDLALVILKIINNNNNAFGLYNYSNLGFTSWYEFTKEIYLQKNIKCKVIPIPSSDYITKAKRPLNSKMNKDKIIKEQNIVIPHWKKSLLTCLENIQ